MGVDVYLFAEISFSFLVQIFGCKGGCTVVDLLKLERIDLSFPLFFLISLKRTCSSLFLYDQPFILWLITELVFQDCTSLFSTAALSPFILSIYFELCIEELHMYC